MHRPLSSYAARPHSLPPRIPTGHLAAILRLLDSSISPASVPSWGVHSLAARQDPLSGRRRSSRLMALSIRIGCALGTFRPRGRRDALRPAQGKLCAPRVVSNAGETPALPESSQRQAGRLRSQSRLRGRRDACAPSGAPGGYEAGSGTRVTLACAALEKRLRLPWMYRTAFS